jgi:hypothetical protein
LQAAASSCPLFSALASAELTGRRWVKSCAALKTGSSPACAASTARWELLPNLASACAAGNRGPAAVTTPAGTTRSTQQNQILERSRGSGR